MVFKNHIGQKIRCYWTWHRTSLINIGKSRRADVVSQTLISGSTLVQGMSCCQMTPSYCLSKCWLITIILWQGAMTFIWGQFGKRHLIHHSLKSTWLEIIWLKTYSTSWCNQWKYHIWPTQIRHNQPPVDDGHILISLESILRVKDWYIMQTCIIT